MSHYKVGICGMGFVGNAIFQFLHPLPQLDVIPYDKYKEMNTLADLFATDVLFLCLPTPYQADLKTYDLQELDNVLASLANQGYTGAVLIKSTILPDYCMKMNQLYPGLKIIHNPEFLSARTAVVDFAQQKQIVLGFTEQSQPLAAYIQTFYAELFPQAFISVSTSECSALMKLGCNSFYATKIQFFTELYLLCQDLHVPYNEVKEMMIKNEWIHPNHTEVPGSDEAISFGGACLPKDIAALKAYMQTLDVPCEVLQAVVRERDLMRG